MMSLQWPERPTAPDASGLPDPFAPLLIRRQRSEAAPAGATPRIAQHQRRARILAATRTLIARDSYEKLTMKSLASFSEVSMQTIYNLVGDRPLVIAHAITDHIQAMAQHAATKADHRTFLLWLVNTYVDCAARNPDYLAQAAISYFDRQPLFAQEEERCAVRIMLTAFHDLKRRDILRDGVDCHQATRRLSVLIAATMRAWAVGTYSLDELRQEMVGGCGLMLMGAVKGSEADHVEAWLAAHLPDRGHGFGLGRAPCPASAAGPRQLETTSR